MAAPPPAAAREGHAASRQVLGGLVAGALGGLAVVAVQVLPLKFAVAAIAAGLLLAVMLAIRNLRLFCLYMAVLMAPLSLRQSFMEFPHLGGASAMFLEAVDPFMLMLLYFQVRERFRGYRPDYVFPRPFRLWIGMILLGVANVLMMDWLRISAANEVVRMLKVLLLAAVVLNEVTNRRQLLHVVVAVMIGVIAQSVVGILEFVRGGQLGLHILGEATDEQIKTLSDATFERARLGGDVAYRVSGLMGHANLLAAYLALFLPVAIALLLTRAPARLKALLAAALAVGLPALVLTLSRAGWIDYMIAFVIVLALGALNAVSRSEFRAARLMIVVVTLAVAAAMAPRIIQRIYETDPSAVQYRLQWLKTAWAMIEDNPVFGTGLNTFVYAQLPYSVEKTPEKMSEVYGDYWPAVHNSWALTWSEQGTVGMLLFVWMHLAVIREGIRNLRIRDPVIHAVGVGLLGGFVAIMADGMASFFIRVEAPARMFWIAMALILAIGHWRRVNEEGPATAAAKEAAPPPGPTPAPARPRWLPDRARALR